MPPTRQVANQPAPVSPKTRPFSFPTNEHLLITTPSSILAWDSAGLHTIFKSSRSGIVAATEAKDGSGVLAVADRHVVVLHDTKRQQEKSWGLNADEDEVRHLQYSTDAKSLFLSTKATGDIQHYSTERTRLLSPPQHHASPPIALAVSPTGHLMVSASIEPPVVYIKNLAHNNAPVLVSIEASATPVSVAAFHPERPNTFLLGFTDGTLAAYDASRVARSKDTQDSDGEIAYIAHLHRSTEANASGSRAIAITGAAFLPGYRTRAVSVGSDGRCRLVDFVDDGIILRTWHAKAPLTSVTVLAVKPPEDRSSARARRDSRRGPDSVVIGGPTSTNNIIAVGAATGKVLLYDSVGLLLVRRSGSEAEKVISVEWVKGPSPKAISATTAAMDVSDVPSVPQKHKVVPGTATIVSQGRTSSTPKTSGLPSLLPPPKTTTVSPVPTAPRRFTLHPDEVADQEGTVRHLPSPKHKGKDPPGAGDYLDLFSPVKPTTHKEVELEQRHVLSPPRSRPRVTSQTFIEDLLPAAGPSKPSPHTRNHDLFPSTDSCGSITPRGTVHKRVSFKPRRDGARISPLGSKRKRLYWRPGPEYHTGHGENSSSLEGFAAEETVTANAKVLADLRKMSGRGGSILSAYAAKARPTKKGNSIDGPIRSKTRAVTDSVDAPGPTGQHADIWITSDEDETARRSKRSLKRPPGRQTSRSRVDSKGTISTNGAITTSIASESSSSSKVQMPGGFNTAFDEAPLASSGTKYWTALTHISPDGMLSPASSYLRGLFPRSSSLSPKKGRKGTSVARGQNSPWAKAKFTKTMSATEPQTSVSQAVPIRDDQSMGTDGALSSSGLVQDKELAPDNGVRRIRSLETEVARMKGEVLALKAALRQHGIPVPPAFR